jgi:hypothetical protein
VLAETPGVVIRNSTRQGQATVEIENDLYKTVLAHTRARLPLSYVFKPTGHEQFVMPTPLDRESKRFEYYGGIIDSIPWVSGPRLPDKGLLWSSPWEIAIQQKTADHAVFTGTTAFEYKDPLSGETCRLRFQKVMEGYSGTSCLAMSYLIENVGQTHARFMMSVHARTGAGGGWSDGDYFFAPGRDAQIYYTSGDWPELASLELRPPCWTRWPLDAACRLKLGEKSRGIFAYLPAPWSCVGDEKEKETLFFVADPANVADRLQEMRMGIFMTNHGYVVEPCLTYRIGAESWTEPESTVMLKPGERCTFQVFLTMYQGVAESEIRALGKPDVLPECLIRKPLQIRTDGDRCALRGEVVCAGRGRLVVRAAGASAEAQPLRTVEMSIGSNPVDIALDAGMKPDGLRVEFIGRAGQRPVVVSKASTAAP